ncbi:MAG: hypothetical protein MUF49_25475 [Oculatellaceae cyanobacterium Prado106]|jgi:hypothetical protein|nr:hypothetical protein [Oculatellaceae cyanobacterium Prado106]
MLEILDVSSPCTSNGDLLRTSHSLDRIADAIFISVILVTKVALFAQPTLMQTVDRTISESVLALCIPAIKDEEISDDELMLNVGGL